MRSNVDYLAYIKCMRSNVTIIVKTCVPGKGEQVGVGKTKTSTLYASYLTKYFVVLSKVIFTLHCCFIPRRRGRLLMAQLGTTPNASVRNYVLYVQFDDITF